MARYHIPTLMQGVADWMQEAKADPALLPDPAFEAWLIKHGYPRDTMQILDAWWKTKRN